jgi:hypothetical protein
VKCGKDRRQADGTDGGDRDFNLGLAAGYRTKPTGNQTQREKKPLHIVYLQ